MKHKKLASLFTAALMVGSLLTSASALSAPLSLIGPTDNSVGVVQPVNKKEYEAVLLNAAVLEAQNADNAVADPGLEQTAPPEQPQSPGDAEENGGFISWYMGLFNSPVFVLCFVGVIGIIALILFKVDLPKKSGKKGSGRGGRTGRPSSRADGL